MQSVSVDDGVIALREEIAASSTLPRIDLVYSDTLRLDQAHGHVPLIVPPAEESKTHRSLMFVTAILVALGYFFVTHTYWGPSHPGVDQNGYQVGGAQFAKTFSTGKTPANEFEYIGWMWIGVDLVKKDAHGDIVSINPKPTYYPKYPLGLPILNAAAIWLSPLAAHGNSPVAERARAEAAAVWPYYINPICASASLLAIFLIVRLLAGSFAGLIGMILLGTSPVMLVLTNNPNSHAADLGFVTWGVYLLLRWWQTGSLWRGGLAGFLLGYAVTIRYTEGLLALPIAAAALLAIRYRRREETHWLFLAAATVIAISGFTWINFSSTPIWLKTWKALIVLGTLVATTPWRNTSAWLRSGRGILSILSAALVYAIIFYNPVTDYKIDADYAKFYVIKVGLLAALVLLWTVPWERFNDWRSPLPVAIGWAIPVGYLVAFNLLNFAALTGYDTSNESSGFTWQMFQDKWYFTLKQLNETGLFIVFPIGVLGLLMGFRWNWRAALLLTLWFIPGVLLYASYYWGNELPGTGYLRFFLTLFPPVAIGAAWLIGRLCMTATTTVATPRPHIAATLAAIALAASIFLLLKGLKLNSAWNGVGMAISLLAAGGVMFAFAQWSAKSRARSKRRWTAADASNSSGPGTESSPLMPILIGIALYLAIVFFKRDSTHTGPLAWLTIDGTALLIATAAAVTIAATMARRIGSASRIVAGVVCGIAAGINVGTVMGAMERDFAMSTNLADTGRRIRSRVPENSLLFADARGINSLLNYIQFAGKNYECYSADAFTNNILRRAMNRKGDPDQPNPLQPDRRDYYGKLYTGKSSNELNGKREQIVSDALARNRQVFTVVSGTNEKPYLEEIAKSGKFVGKVVEKWREPVEMTPAAKTAQLGMRAGFGGTTPQAFQIIEVRMKGT